MKDLEFTIITGLSGAGKSEAIRCFEDMGYFCIDNLPPTLIPKVAELLSLPGSKVRKVALVVDVRGREYFNKVWDVLRELKGMQINQQILYLEASDDTLVKRFKETRRRHPLAEGGEVIDGIKRERDLLSSLKEAADMVIDTTGVATYELKEKIRSQFVGGPVKKGLLVSVISFGYKYGVPMDADLVIDVRFLPNPHYVDELSRLTGEDEEVREFVLKRPVTKSFLKKFESLLSYLMPHYVKEGKTHFTIALGCTGGTHRSVTLAEEIQKFLKDKGYNVIVRHRDVGREFEAEREFES